MNNGLTAENLLLALPEALRQDEQMQALAAGIAEVWQPGRRRLTDCSFIPELTSCRRLLLDRLAMI